MTQPQGFADQGPSPVELAQGEYDRAREQMSTAHSELTAALREVSRAFHELAEHWVQTPPGELPPSGIHRVASPAVAAHQAYDEAWDATTEAARKLADTRRGRPIRRDRPVRG